MMPRTSFAFDRQRVVVAGEDSVTIAFAIATLRSDGHCVTHAADAGSGSWDFAIRECHLLIVGTSLSGEAGPKFLEKLRVAVRPLLPQLRMGAVQARDVRTSQAS